METRKIIQSTGVVGALTLVSRGMGLVRDILMAGLFGTSMAMSAFVVAFRIPNLFRALFGEGALSSAFIPVFVETRYKEGDAAGWVLARRVITLTGAVLAVLVLAGILATTGLLSFAELGAKSRLILSLLRIMLPYLFFICLAAVLMGAMNALHRFFIPALVPWLLNATLIAAMLWVCPRLGDTQERQIYGVAAAVGVAGLLQWMVPWPAMMRLGWSPRPIWSFRDPRLTRILLLMGPTALGRAVTQVNVMIDSLLAAWIAPWAPAALFYSERLIYLPLGLIATALGTVLLPVFSGHAARNDHAAIRTTVQHSLRLLIFIMVPAAAGLFVLSEPILRMIFEWRSFSAESTRLTALALRCYAPGLLVFGLGKVFVPAFYAMQDTRTPVRVGVVTVAINIVLSVALMLALPLPWKHAGIALATVIAETLNGLAMAVALHVRIGSPGWRAIGRSAGVTLACSAPMAWAAWGAHRFVAGLGPAGKAGQVTAVLAGLAAGVVSYLALAWLARAPEARDLADALRRKTARRRTAA
jgi:putative peptidoglycan lipid II flippase